jgi:hypothetical protein
VRRYLDEFLMDPLVLDFPLARARRAGQGRHPADAAG